MTDVLTFLLWNSIFGPSFDYKALKISRCGLLMSGFIWQQHYDFFAVYLHFTLLAKAIIIYTIFSQQPIPVL